VGVAVVAVDGRSGGDGASEETIALSRELAAELASIDGALLMALRERLGSSVHLRGTRLTVAGGESEVALTVRVVEELAKLVEAGHEIGAGSVDAVLGAIDAQTDAREFFDDVICRHRGRTITPKTINQKRYTEAIRSATATFAIGPAGTGKTYLAMALAVSALQTREVSRIILTRPAVEAGESLGFLPGDMMAKVDPYLRPLFDALYDMMDGDRVHLALERGQIEVAPLAFMRGRTLNDSFVILDEAQNTSPEQMHMFLTRLGFGSRMVVTGDVTQIDLPRGQESGLVRVRHILEGIDGIQFVELGDADVVRHQLVQRIVEAYGRFASREAALRADET
jgi:phosphate starvation-inducible PhoH-like protein